MHSNPSQRRSRQRVRIALVALIASGVTGPACLSRPLEPENPRTTSTILEKLSQSGVDKIDLLLAVDNSRSMADKQKLLGVAVPDLVNRLVNPECIDANMIALSTQPKSPKDPCPAGSVREFQPVLDIHIGLVDSSLGDHGAESACPDLVPNDTKDCANGATNYSNNDHGHLLTRKDPCLADTVPTYQSLGFLAWDPTGLKDKPAGETNVGKLKDSITDLVNGEGQIGCGFESQEEGWLRFLVDPDPYQSIAVVKGQAVKTGRDDVLLKQRSDFLRSSSLLAIVVLTDENDGSAREGGQYYLVGDTGNYHLPPARSECKTNPNDPCCFSCAQDPGTCPADPTCEKALPAADDPPNLRMFDNKRRFGIDFLYPWQRYVNALSQKTINPAAADLAATKANGVPNPIFSDLQPNDSDTTVRTPDLVFLAGIVGVPWQDIVRDAKGSPIVYKSADNSGVDELSAVDPKTGLSTWDVILGDPDANKPPADPFMIEQIDPRTPGAKNPVTGDAVQSPSTPSSGDNSINGHEWANSGRDDLQYACIFTLPSPKVCFAGDSSCDCPPTGVDNATNPLCAPNPMDGMNPTLQTKAKGYPGLRHLQILKGLKKQAIVASVCPATTDLSKADYGYRPAVGAIIDRLKVKLNGQCLPRTLTPDAAGEVPCVIIEASKTTGQCKCDGAARRLVPEAQEQAVEGAKADPSYAAEGWNCFCEITQCVNDPKGGPALTVCQESEADTGLELPNTTTPVDGWCYVDATTAPPLGNTDIVKDCAATEKRMVRFVGEGKGTPGSTLFITCSGGSDSE